MCFLASNISRNSTNYLFFYLSKWNFKRSPIIF